MAEEILAFNRWSTEGIEVNDEGLKRYINLEPRMIPSTGARYAGVRFHKSNAFIIERIINKIMIAGHKGKKHVKSSSTTTGKKQTAYDTMESVLELIEGKTKMNPIQVVVTAIVNGAPREEITTIEYGGARYPKVVECAPQRRIDITIKLMIQGASHKAFKSKKTMISALADEFISAYNLSQTSNAVAKKLEIERQADSSR